MSFYDINETYYKNNVAIEASGLSVTYKDMYDFAAKIGELLEERTLVFFFCNNSIGSLLGYITFLQNKTVPVLLSEGTNLELARDLMRTYQPKYLYIPISLMPEMVGYEALHEEYEYVLLKTNFNESYPLYDELALLLTTSGSTGSPKLVRQSYKNINANAESIANYLELDDRERPITTLPMNYTYGLSIINSHLLVGATLLLTDKGLMQREFWDFFNKEGATSFGGVPYTYEMLKRLRFLNKDLPSLRTMTQAGGKLSPELHKEFAEYAEKYHKHFVVMYGQTEATARMAYLPHEKALEKYGSMGIAIPGGKFTLIDATGQVILEPNVTGELVYEGPNVTLGYAQCGDDLSKEDERNGKLETGDMAEQDEDGFFYIVGRKKRFLKIFGNRVNLDETERLIKRKFLDLECASSGVDDLMYIFITDWRLCDEVRDYISEVTHLNSVAFKVRAIDAIPKNDAGKTLYKELEEFYDKN